MVAKERERRQSVLARVLAVLLTVGSLASGINALVQVGRLVIAALQGLM